MTADSPLPGRLQEPPDISDADLAEIAAILYCCRGFDMSAYKDNCMKRRVAIRMRSTGNLDASRYCDLLCRSNQELDLLRKTLTIHVSQFFRNSPVFETVHRTVLPALFAGWQPQRDEPLRFWCLGCAGGEEPYTLAIILREFFREEISRAPVSILASDIDAEILHEARRAEYGEDRLREMPAALRQRYFCQIGRRFSLIPEIREMVTFVRSDIIHTDEYVSSNLVLCRNTLIYFTRSEQERILLGIADILRPGGILVLGKSESLTGDAHRRFTPVCRAERIYRRL